MYGDPGSLLSGSLRYRALGVDHADLGVPGQEPSLSAPGASVDHVQGSPSLRTQPQSLDLWRGRGGGLLFAGRFRTLGARDPEVGRVGLEVIGQSLPTDALGPGGFGGPD